MPSAGAVTPYDRRAGAVRHGSALSTYKRLIDTAKELTRQMKARGINPKTSLERKNMLGNRKGRKIPAIRSGSAVSGGDYSQITYAKMRTGRKKRTTLRRLTKEIRNKAETVVYRFQGMKVNDDWGYYWMSLFNSADTTTYLPFYVYDLTSVINSMSTGVVAARPLMRANVTNVSGRINFTNMFGQSPDGTSTSLNLQTERAPSSGSGIVNPHEKSRLLWNEVRLNLWGAKQKAVKYTIQVVKLEDRLDPWKLTSGTTPDDLTAQAFYQSLVKPATYNPIAALNPGIAKGMKVLKTYTTVIQPTSTTENDADPHSKVFKWFMRWDRDLNYKQDAPILTSAQNLYNEADYNQGVQYNDCYTKSTSKIYLFIRATNYSVSIAEDSTKSGSFDLMVRSCHVPQV